jgi:superfamily I DNA/RNA helicase
MGDKIAIIFHLNKHVYGYAKGLEQAGIPVEVPKARSDSDFFQVDFNSDKPKVLNFHVAKGLTFDTIIMPQLTKRCFPRLDEEHIERLLFVGITRAT